MEAFRVEEYEFEYRSMMSLNIFTGNSDPSGFYLIEKTNNFCEIAQHR